MTQASLFGPRLSVPYQRTSRTSRQAAIAVTRRGQQGVKLLRLLEAYRAAGEAGCTGAELVAATGLPIQSICSLRVSAKRQGYLVPAGERKGPYGLAQQVHRITSTGLAALRTAGR